MGGCARALGSMPRSSGLAPCSSSRRSTPEWPCAAASRSAAVPVAQQASTVAPPPSSSRATASWPPQEAWCSGVFMSCTRSTSVPLCAGTRTVWSSGRAHLVTGVGVGAGLLQQQAHHRDGPARGGVVDRRQASFLAVCPHCGVRTRRQQRARHLGVAVLRRVRQRRAVVLRAGGETAQSACENPEGQPATLQRATARTQSRAFTSAPRDIKKLTISSRPF